VRDFTSTYIDCQEILCKMVVQSKNSLLTIQIFHFPFCFDGRWCLNMNKILVEK